MARLTGRYGQILYTPAAGTEHLVMAMNAFTVDMETEYEDVSCFNDPNRVYVPGLLDMSGDLEGVYDSAELSLLAAARATTPGQLKLVINSSEPGFFFKGPAYIDISIDASLEAPKVSGSWKAAGAWTTPGMVAATGASPGTGMGTYTPAGAAPPANLAALQAGGITASPATAWTTGQFIVLGDGSLAHWTGSAWAAGAKP